MAVIAALPAVGLQFWNEHDLRLARPQAAEIDRLAEGARQFLVALAQIPQVNGADTAGCADLLIQIRANYRAYRAIIVADAGGNVVCSSIGPGPGIADRAYFRLAVQSNDFAAGNYVEGRGTNAPGPRFAYPLHDQQGKITGVVAAALDLDWFAARLRDKLPQNASLTVVDRIGTIVVRFPENDLVRRGRPVPDEFRPRIYAAEPGVVHTRGLDGNMRVVGYVPIAASE